MKSTNDHAQPGAEQRRRRRIAMVATATGVAGVASGLFAAAPAGAIYVGNDGRDVETRRGSVAVSEGRSTRRAPQTFCNFSTNANGFGQVTNSASVFCPVAPTETSIKITILKDGVPVRTVTTYEFGPDTADGTSVGTVLPCSPGSIYNITYDMVAVLDSGTQARRINVDDLSCIIL